MLHPETVSRWKGSRMPVTKTYQGRACTVYGAAESAPLDLLSEANAFSAAASLARRFFELDPVPTATPSTVGGQASARPSPAHPRIPLTFTGRSPYDLVVRTTRLVVPAQGLLLPDALQIYEVRN